MTVERGLRALAGLMTLVSLALAHWLSPWWLLLTAFVGLTFCNRHSPIGARRCPCYAPLVSVIVKAAARASDSMTRRGAGNAYRDSVYRAIFQLEAGKIGASKALCDSVRRAWLNEQTRTDPEFLAWLHKITPMCLALIASSGESCRSALLTTRTFTSPIRAGASPRTVSRYSSTSVL
jgi:hypothetical protein